MIFGLYFCNSICRCSDGYGLAFSFEQNGLKVVLHLLSLINYLHYFLNEPRAIQKLLLHMLPNNLQTCGTRLLLARLLSRLHQIMVSDLEYMSFVQETIPTDAAKS
jgi:hypothetical protein